MTDEVLAGQTVSAPDATLDPSFDPFKAELDKLMGSGTVPASNPNPLADRAETLRQAAVNSQATGEQPAPQAQQEVTEGTEQEILAGVIKVTPDTLILDPRDGKQKPWKEIEGLAQLKKETDAEKFDLNRQKQALSEVKTYIDRYLPMLTALERSTFLQTTANVLASNPEVTEDKAINAGLAAIGKTSFLSNGAEANPDPEPQIPADFDTENPEHLAVAQKHLLWEQRQQVNKLVDERMKKEVEPLRQRLEAQDKAAKEAADAKARQDAQLKQVFEHNQKMYANVPTLLKFDPKTLSAEQQREFFAKLDTAASELGLTEEYIRTKPLSEAEVYGMVQKAFPGGANPFAAPQPNGAAGMLAATLNANGATTKKPPLSAGVNGAGNGIQAGSYSNISETERIRMIMEGMATGKPVAGVPQF